MDIHAALKDVWSNSLLRQISSQTLFAWVIAVIIHLVLAVGIALAAVAQTLTGLGFSIGQAALRTV